MISDLAGAFSHSGMPSLKALAASRPASALPLVSVMPRPCLSTSRKWRDRRLATYQAEASERVARMKCTISLPEPSIMPNTVSSGSAGARS